MVFSSLLFIFLFLTLHLIFYYLCGKKYRNVVLLVFSLIFYAWGEPIYLVLLVGETFISWYLSLSISRTQSPAKRKCFLIVECIALLGLLGFFKYTGFLLRGVRWLFGFPSKIPQIALPLGISFYTFQLLSYVVDVYRRDVKVIPPFWKLLLYSSLFHQCIAGPIIRYETVASEIDSRTVSRGDIYAGIRRFSVGIAKKSILANSCASAADTLLPAGVEALQTQSAGGLWLGMLFYMLQIYLDFSAYSDMAIGMGRMVGFHYPENFNYPYTAHSVQDFWRRWHISLSSFFRDYVYIPLGGSRCSLMKWIRNMAIVWFLTGLWHGANINFILWGLYYFVFLVLEKLVIKDRLPRPVSHICTLLIVYFGWILFRFENPNEMAAVLRGMFGIGGVAGVGLEAATVFFGNIFFLIFAIAAVTPIGKKLHKLLYRMSKSHHGIFLFYQITDMLTPALLLLLSVLSLTGASYNPFLYFNF